MMQDLVLKPIPEQQVVSGIEELDEPEELLSGATPATVVAAANTLQNSAVFEDIRLTPVPKDTELPAAGTTTEEISDPRVDITTASALSLVTPPSPPSLEQQVWDQVHRARYHLSVLRQRFGP